MAASRIITLLTDFGLRDYFVGAMKGVMLSINPNLHFVDISHMIPPQDIRSGAFTLGQAYFHYPLGTIHLAVVDPGVGTERKPLLVTAGGHYFVAPDNGILTSVFEREEDCSAYEIAADHYFLKPLSNTFHARDIFAPVAAWISRDIQISAIGPIVEKPVRLTIPGPTKVKENLFQAAILAVDQFGNLITNLKAEHAPAYAAPGTRGCKIILSGNREITSFCSTFAEGKEGEPFVLSGSSGYLEIAIRNGSAARTLQLGPGAGIGLLLL